MVFFLIVVSSACFVCWISHLIGYAEFLNLILICFSVLLLTVSLVLGYLQEVSNSLSRTGAKYNITYPIK